MSERWLLVVVGLPLLALWLAALVEVVRRSDLASSRRVLWLVGLVAAPIVGLGIYIVVRPPHASRRRNRDVDVTKAEAIVVAAERRQRGEWTDAEYLAAIADRASVE